MHWNQNMQMQGLTRYGGRNLQEGGAMRLKEGSSASLSFCTVINNRAGRVSNVVHSSGCKAPDFGWKQMIMLMQL